MRENTSPFLFFLLLHMLIQSPPLVLSTFLPRRLFPFSPAGCILGVISPSSPFSFRRRRPLWLIGGAELMLTGGGKGGGGGGREGETHEGLSPPDKSINTHYLRVLFCPTPSRLPARPRSVSNQTVHLMSSQVPRGLQGWSVGRSTKEAERIFAGPPSPLSLATGRQE